MRTTITSVQFLRFVAATLVVLFHTSRALGKYFPGSISALFAHVATFGGSGVHIFFVISGFVMVYTSFRRPNDKFNAPEFIAKRLIRIYPIYFIYAGFYLSFHYAFSHGYDLTGLQFLGAITLFPGYSAYIIGPGWTLAYEMYFYVCFGVAMMLGLVRGITVLTFLFLAAIACRVLLHINESEPTWNVLTNSLLIEFLAGAWIGYAVVNSIRVGNEVANLMWGAGIVIFLADIAFGYEHFPALLTWGLPSGLLVAGLVFKERNGCIPRLIKKYSFMGDSSYSLYLLHIVLIDAALIFAFHVDKLIASQAAAIGTVGWVIISITITIYCVMVTHVAYNSIERKVVNGLRALYGKMLAALPV